MARVRLGRATRSSWQTVVLPPPDGAERTINKGQFFSLVMALCRPGEGGRGSPANVRQGAGARLPTRPGCRSGAWIIGVGKMPGHRSFDVLRLFAKFFQLRLERDHFARDQAVVGFGADGVDLAVHLLGEEIEGAPDRLLRLQAIVKLL